MSFHVDENHEKCVSAEVLGSVVSSSCCCGQNFRPCSVLLELCVCVSEQINGLPSHEGESDD